MCDTNEEETYDRYLIPEGVHSVRIMNAYKARSGKGHDMIVIQLEVKGYVARLYYYIPFIDGQEEITNRRISQFFDSFQNIRNGDCDMSHWIGRVGACRVRHEAWQSETRAVIQYFIPADECVNIPPWN
jgi:hypothetical protein